MRRRVVGLYLLALSAAVFVGCSEKPPVDIPHSAIIVNLSSDVEGRRPLLRVDVTLQHRHLVLRAGKAQHAVEPL